MLEWLKLFEFVIVKCCGVDSLRFDVLMLLLQENLDPVVEKGRGRGDTRVLLLFSQSYEDYIYRTLMSFDDRYCY